MVIGAVLVSSALLGQKKTREERREEATQRSVQGAVTGPDDQPAVGAIVQVKDMRTIVHYTAGRHVPFRGAQNRRRLSAQRQIRRSDGGSAQLEHFR
jgi:hypothetical protein